MLNRESLNRDALIFAVCNMLAASYEVHIDYIPENYTAANIMCWDEVRESERTMLANSCIHILEHCVHVSAYDFTYITFPDMKTPEITLSDGSSFLLLTNMGKKKSWRASRSAGINNFFTVIDCPVKNDWFSDMGNEQAPLDIVANQLFMMDSPRLAHQLVKSLVPVSSFIALDINQKACNIQSTSFFYSKCGNIDKRVDLPHGLLEIRRKNETTLRCIYDKNWLVDIRLRRNTDSSRYRLEWFLKDYPVGAICQTSPIEMPVQVRVSV